MLRRHSARSGLTLGELLVILVIILLLCAIFIPGLLSSRRASNERSASSGIKTLASAESDFRANDRDGNHVNDFWTADVKGLYTMTSAEVRGPGTAPKDPSIKLIEIEVAAADGDGTFFAAAGENMALETFAPPAARKGYWYGALLCDRTLKDTSEATYRVETGGTPRMGAVHNTSKFGFMAFPEGSSGKYAFIVNENNTIFREKLTEDLPKGNSVPPGLDLLPAKLRHWPSDDDVKTPPSGPLQ